MKNSTAKRLVSLILSLAMVLSLLTGCAAGGPIPHAPIPFDEMEGISYDAEAAEAALKQLNELSAESGHVKELIEAYEVIVEQYDNASTDYALALIRYYQNASDEEAFKRYSELELECTRLGDAILTALRSVLGSSYGEMLQLYIADDALIEQAMNYVPMTDEEFRLVEENTALVDEYNTLMDGNPTPSGAAAIYLKILDNLIAQAKFSDTYGSYAEIAYAEYGRDYTPADAEQMYKFAREFAVPYYKKLLQNLQTNAKLQAQLMSYYYSSFSEAQLRDAVRPYVTEIHPQAAELFALMEENELFDLEESDTKLQAGFTIGLTSYGMPFIFVCPVNGAASKETLMHEFGHSLNEYAHPEHSLYSDQSLDVAEIDSQGMEVLMLKNAKNIFGSCSNAAVQLVILGLLESVIDGCMFDEFQQKALAARMEGTLKTPGQVTELYLEVEKSYFGAMEEWGTGWYQVSHTFESPFYYLSYAVSAAAALSLLLEAQKDYAQAVEIYCALIDMGSGESFRYTLSELGLADPFDEEGRTALIKGMRDYMNSLLGTKTGK